MTTISDLFRRIAQLLNVGTIASVEPSFVPRIKVKIGGLLTRSVPHPAHIGRNWRGWFPLRVGQQVTTAAAGGEPGNTAVTGAAYSVDIPSPSADLDVDMVRFNDGTEVWYDSAKGHLWFDGANDVTISAGHTLTLTAKNVVIKTGEEGFYQLDNYGRASRLTHVAGPLFTSEAWATGSTVRGLPDHGFTPPAVEVPE